MLTHVELRESELSAGGASGGGQGRPRAAAAAPLSARLKAWPGLCWALGAETGGTCPAHRGLRSSERVSVGMRTRIHTCVCARTHMLTCTCAHTST